MGLFRRRRSATSGADRADGPDARRATIEHLAEFTRTRVGVEAYVEPVTPVTPTTVVLVATTGEWTRRRVRDEATARRIARDLGIPVYDVNLTGYPQRMRTWSSQQRTGR